jgi:hypothetical protein
LYWRRTIYAGPRKNTRWRAERDLNAIAKKQDGISNCEQARPMCDNDESHSSHLRLPHSGTQRLLPVGIEIRIGLVQKDQPAMTVERPRKANPLALPARKFISIAADFRLISLWQGQDHLVSIRKYCGRNYIFIGGAFIEAGDRFGNRPSKKGHFLGKIADELA